MNNKNKEFFDEIKIMINSPLITQINSQIISSFSDFNGIFLGRTKIIKKIKTIDVEDSIQTKTLNILIENIIFIYDEKYTYEKIEDLIKKIEDSYSEFKIIGAFSAKAFSFPVLSLKSQKFYFKLNNNMKKFISIPFEIINLKETNYNMDTNPIPNKFIQYKYNDNCKNEVDKLNRGINYQLNHLKEDELNEIKELKLNIKKEIEKYIELNKQIKNYNK